MATAAGRTAARSAADPRGAALALLEGVRGGAMLGELVAADAGPLAGLDAAGRARAQRLALATLREAGRADSVMDRFLRRPPPDPVRDILRLATVEVCALGGAAHGVVNAAVGLARRNPETAGHAGLVNAVLRQVSGVAAADWQALPPPRLPDWLRRALVADWGKAAVARIETAHLAGPALDLTLRDADTAADWAARLGARVLPTGGLRLAPGVQVSALPGYAEGAWWVQDAAAALPARLLAVQPGERVLDLCAAPGGKTMQLAAAGAAVTAVDGSASRMERLRANLSRTGLSAQAVVADLLDWAPDVPADAILLDAPCSATGTIRRHPDLPLARRPGDIPALVTLQARMLDRALGWLAPGGRLVFCTCSLLRDEGERQVTEALARHPGLRIDTPPDLPGLAPHWRSRMGGLRLRPDDWADLGGLDGFYMARLSFAPEVADAG